MKIMFPISMYQSRNRKVAEINAKTEKNIWDNMQTVPFISDKDANQLEKGGETNPYYMYENIRDEWYNYKKTQDDKEY